MMLPTCREFIFTGKHIMNILTHLMITELFTEVASGDLSMKGDGSLRAHPTGGKKTQSKGPFQVSHPTYNLGSLTSDGPQFSYL